MKYKLHILTTIRRYIGNVSLLLIIPVINLTSCHYYKVKQIETPPDNINNALSEKYIILHMGAAAWHLKAILIDNEAQTLTAAYEHLPESQKQYLKTNPQSYVNRYKKKEGNPTYQVHLYVSGYTENIDKTITFPISDIQKIEVYDEAIGATTASYIFGTIGSIAGAMVVILIIAILTKSSCPFIYTNDGISYSFAGELYGGAISKSLERDDYLSLPGLKSVDGIYTIKITNELLERQYTNIAELIVAEHPIGTFIAIDPTGNYQLIGKPVLPISVTSPDQSSQLAPLSIKDMTGYSFNVSNTTDINKSSLTLSFPKPSNQDTGKLFIHAKNTYWLDYTYGEFTKLFGNKYSQFVENQKKTPAKQSIQWSIDQNIPLSIYLETENGWQFIDYLNVTGPLASRDFVIPLDIRDIKGQIINIKLECGFLFWDIDYAAMDFTPNTSVRIHKISAESAIDENGKDIRSNIQFSDSKYLEQPDVGNVAILKFQAPYIQQHLSSTAIFHSRGYYEYIRNFNGKPDMGYLLTFKNKGRFTEFAREKYDAITRDTIFISKALKSE